MKQIIYIASIVEKLLRLLVKKKVITRQEAKRILNVKKEVPAILIRKQQKVIE